MGIRARPFYSGVQSDDQFASGRFPTSLFNCNRSAIADSSAEHCAAARLSQFTLLFSPLLLLITPTVAGTNSFIAYLITCVIVKVIIYASITCHHQYCRSTSGSIEQRVRAVLMVVLLLRFATGLLPCRGKSTPRRTRLT